MKLVIEGVGKLYNGKVWGLRDFGLELGPGVLGLLGPNGAGKSTLSGWPTRAEGAATPPTTGQMLFHALYRH